MDIYKNGTPNKNLGNCYSLYINYILGEIILEFKITFLTIVKNVEKFILGEKKPKDHWKKYRKSKK